MGPVATVAGRRRPGASLDTPKRGLATPLPHVTHSTQPGAVDARTRARRGLAIFFGALVAGSALLEWLILHRGAPVLQQLPLVFALMWMPALASLVARVALRDGVRDISFRLGGTPGLRGIIIGVAVPLAVGAVAYGGARAAGLVNFAPPVEIGRLSLSGVSPFVRFCVLLALAVGPLTVFSMLSAAGEEIGWRGYMLTRLVDAGVPYPLVASGVIWALWHFPLILSGQYAAGPHPLLSAWLFLVDVIGIALAIGVLRLDTGSVWPAIVLHGAWNAIIQGPFDRSFTGPGAALWVGESGVLVAIASLAVGIVLVRRPWRVRHYPSERVDA